MLERAHRQLKDALCARLAATDWPAHLPWVLLGLRSAPKEAQDVLSADLIYGSPVALPGQLVGAPAPSATDLADLASQPGALSIPVLHQQPESSSLLAPLEAAMHIFVH